MDSWDRPFASVVFPEFIRRDLRNPTGAVTFEVAGGKTLILNVGETRWVHQNNVARRESHNGSLDFSTTGEQFREIIKEEGVQLE
jgi:hypothetical protein